MGLKDCKEKCENSREKNTIANLIGKCQKALFYDMEKLNALFYQIADGYKPILSAMQTSAASKSAALCLFKRAKKRSQQVFVKTALPSVAVSLL